MQKFDSMKQALRSELKPRARLVLQCLILHCNRDGKCFPSIKTIATECNYSVSTVKRALGELCEAGLLQKQARFDERKKGGQTSNLYSLPDLSCVSGESMCEWTKIFDSQPDKEDSALETENTEVLVNTNLQENDAVFRTLDIQSIIRWTGVQSKAEPP